MILWKQQGLISATDALIKHSEQAWDLLNALLLPNKLAIVIIESHIREYTHERKEMSRLTNMLTNLLLSKFD